MRLDEDLSMKSRVVKVSKFDLRKAWVNGQLGKEAGRDRRRRANIIQRCAG
jgi:hypothetical protein